jgi:hypothetical protein
MQAANVQRTMRDAIRLMNPSPRVVVALRFIAG